MHSRTYENPDEEGKLTDCARDFKLDCFYSVIKWFWRVFQTQEARVKTYDNEIFM